MSRRTPEERERLREQMRHYLREGYVTREEIASLRSMRDILEEPEFTIPERLAELAEMEGDTHESAVTAGAIALEEKLGLPRDEALHYAAAVVEASQWFVARAALETHAQELESQGWVPFAKWARRAANR